LPTLNSIFKIDQGQQITDEELYHNQGNIPVLTGRNDIKGYWDESRVDEEDLPCITYPTKGNSGTVYIQRDLFNVNNTAILVPYENWRNRLELEWFAHKLETEFRKIMTSKHGVSYLNRDIVKDLEVEVPDKNRQKNELKCYKDISKILSKVEDLLEKIGKLKQKSLTFEDEEEVHSLDNFLEYTSRNDELSKEGIYNRSAGLENAEDTIDVLSGSFDGIYGKVPKKDSLNYIEESPCLHVITRGVSASEVRSVRTGTYATNTNAMLVTIKESAKENLNIGTLQEEEKYLRFLETVLQPYFSDYASNSDHSIFPITKVLNNIDVPKIKLNSEIEAVAESLMVIDKYEKRLLGIKEELKELREKEIEYADS